MTNHRWAVPVLAAAALLSLSIGPADAQPYYPYPPPPPQYRRPPPPPPEWVREMRHLRYSCDRGERWACRRLREMEYRR